MPSRKNKSGAPRQTKSKKRLGRMSQVRQKAGNPQPYQTKGRGVTNRGDLMTMNRLSAGGQHVQKPGVVVKEELVALVSGSTTFVATKFALQPANATSFPLGSPEAKNWTEWQCDYMEYEYIPTVSEFNTQGQVGEVIGGFDYNAANSAPTSMNQVEALDWAGGGIPAERWCLKLQPNMINRADPKYVRVGALPPGDDIRLYDGGNFWFCTTGCTNTNQIGKIVARYFFRVRKPNLLNPSAGVSSAAATSFYTNHAATVFTTATPKAIPFDTLTADPLGVGAGAAGVFTPPAGAYRVAVTASFVDSLNDTLTGKIELFKNGASLTNKVISQASFETGGVLTTTLALALSGLITANGSDTFQVQATITGATGVLTNVADACTMVISIA